MGSVDKFGSIIIGCMRLGKWGAQFSTQEYLKFIEGCLDMGASHFDHADIYGDYTTEEEFGNAIRLNPGLKNKLHITTKCGIKMPCSNRPSYPLKSYETGSQHIIESVENSLRNLAVEKIDMLLIHRPDMLMDVEQIAECISSLKNSGKVIGFGVSNFSTHQVQWLSEHVDIEMHQLEISLFNLDVFENGILEQSQSKGIAVSAWSPFGGGQLFDLNAAKHLKLNQCLSLLSQKYSCDYSQIALSWLKNHPVDIIPVIGSTKLQRVQEAMQAVQLKLTKEEWYELLEAVRGHEVA